MEQILIKLVAGALVGIKESGKNHRRMGEDHERHSPQAIRRWSSSG